MRISIHLQIMKQKEGIDLVNPNLLAVDIEELLSCELDSLIYSSTSSGKMEEHQKNIDYQTYLLQQKAKLATSTFMQHHVQIMNQQNQNIIDRLNNSMIYNYQNFKELVQASSVQFESYRLRKSLEQTRMNKFMQRRCKITFYDYQNSQTKISQQQKLKIQKLVEKISIFDSYSEVVQKIQFGKIKLAKEHSLMYFASLLSKSNIYSYQEATGKQFHDIHLDQFQGKYNWQKLFKAEKEVLPNSIPPFLVQSYIKVKINKNDLSKIYQKKAKNQTKFLYQTCKSLLQSHKFLVLVYHQIIREANQFKRIILKKFQDFQFFAKGSWYYSWKIYLYERLYYLKQKIQPRYQHVVKKNSIKTSLNKLAQVEETIRHYWGRTTTLDDQAKQQEDLYSKIRGSLWQTAITLRQIGEDFFYTLSAIDFKDFYFDYMLLLKTETYEQYSIQSFPLQKFQQMIKQNTLNKEYLHRIGVGEQIRKKIIDIQNFFKIRENIEGQTTDSSVE